MAPLMALWLTIFGDSTTSSSEEESEELSKLLPDDTIFAGGTISSNGLNLNHRKSNGWTCFTNFSNTTIGSTIGA